MAESSVVVIVNESSVVVFAILKVPVILPLPVPLNALIVGFVRVLFVKVCEAVNNAIALVFDKSVDAIVMSLVPLKLCPAMFLAVASSVAVLAFPVTVPVKLPANVVAVTVPFTCNAVVGSEVPIPTRLFVTSRYSRFVSNARSVPFLVKFDFSTDPVIRPMAIPGTPYNNVSTAYAVHSFFIIAS